VNGRSLAPENLPSLFSSRRAKEEKAREEETDQPVQDGGGLAEKCEHSTFQEKGGRVDLNSQITLISQCEFLTLSGQASIMGRSPSLFDF
jgi:hypothetical protein